MNQKIYDHLKKYCKKNEYNFENDEDILETLQDSGEEIYSEKIDYKRWWNDIFKVVKIDGMLIGYNDARTTGDRSPSDCGWEFDPESCCEVEKITETKIITSYKPLK